MCVNTRGGSEGAGTFPVVPGDRPRGDGHKLRCRKFHLAIRGKNLSRVRHQSRFPREVFVSLEVPRTGPVPEEPAG